MSKTYSAMLPLGTPAPEFVLPDVISEQPVSLSVRNTYAATVIVFICNHCPYVKHINHALIQLANDYLPKNIRFIAINANDTEIYPDDAPDKMRELALLHHYPFPYLFDETQEVARAYNATCTPDCFVFNQDLRLVYRGQLDDSRPGNTMPTDAHCIRDALDNTLLSKPVDSTQKPSMGCNIKWKPSNQ